MVSMQYWRNLPTFPSAANFHQRLVVLDIDEYRQVHHKPWRMIYTVGDAAVYVLLIADGRRDMRALLRRRLLHDEGG